MIRISFRQGLLTGFAIVVLLLGGASIRSWLVVEHFVAQGRENADQALQVAASIQELGERTVDVERSARQFLLLKDPVIHQRFDDHLAQALAVVDRLDALDAKPLRNLLGGWREGGEALRLGLEQDEPAARLVPVMARLAEINGLLKGAGQHWIDIRNSAQLAELETSRLWLGSQIALALTGAAFVILAVGWWLVRPLQNLERAIERLGEKRFDMPVVVGGPVDFRQIGGQLDRLRQRLAGLEADRERSLRHVSHELKTPLTALREGVALLQDEIPGPLGSAQREIVAILRNNVMALQRQIEGLLSLNAASFGSGRIIRRPIDIRGLLADTVRDRQLHTQARQLTLEIDAPARQVSVDPEKLAVIVDNLLSNAIDFSPDGGEIRLLARVSDGMLHLECIDQGPGVAEEDHERIFEPFVQGRRKSMVPRHGSGVGLSIVRELASAMGGRVGILAGDGGAHFFVDIPDGKQRQSGL